MSTKTPQRNYKRWTTKEKRRLPGLAKVRTATEVAKTFRRTAPAVQQFAMRNGISFRA